MNRTIARLLLALFLLPPLAVAAMTQSQSDAAASSAPTATPAPEQGIPIPEIITSAEQVKRPLREIAARVTANAEVAAIADHVQSGEAQLPAQVRQVEERLTTAPTLYELRDLERNWRQRKAEMDAWQKTLSQQGTQAEADLRWLRNEQVRWTQTLNSIDDPDLLETVYERIRSVLSETQRLQTKAEAQLTQLLSLQDRVSQQDLLVTSLTDQIARARQRFQGRLLARDNRPLWAALLHPREQDEMDPLAESSGDSFMHELSAAREGLKTQAQTIVLLVLLFVVVLWGNIVLARKIDPLTADDEPLHQSARVLKRPASVALLITLLVYLRLSPPSASIGNSIAALLLLIPFLRVGRLLVEPPAWLRMPLYVLAILHLSDQVRFLADIEAVIERVIFLGEVAAAGVVIVWMLRPARFSELSGSRFTLKWLRRTLYLTLALLAVSFLGNVFGFLTLAKVLGEGVLHSAYLGALLYATARVVIIVTALLLRTERARTLMFIRLHRPDIIFWIKRGIYFVTALLWLNGALEQFTIRDQVIDLVKRVLNASIGFRSLSVTIGDVLSFVLVAVAAYYSARIIRLILQEDVLTRLPLKRGVPQAIATAIQYLLLFIGFVMALTAAGFELNRLTLLTGAFGVGIGFGLQNIINNFVSGLILLFERPVQVGDAVQIGATSGDITRIGIRSSTISTAQGAEVIVPNAKLISDEVTNWTLSSQVRRVEIPVGVSYESNPDQVMKLLVAAAKADPDVLNEPEPFAVFKGFGDNALDFELRFWVPYRSHVGIKSRVTLAISNALNKAGINIPFPQRDLRLTVVDGDLKDTLKPAQE